MAGGGQLLDDEDEDDLTTADIEAIDSTEYVIDSVFVAVGDMFLTSQYDHPSSLAAVFSLYSTPYTLQPILYTLHPPPYSPHLLSFTLDPRPWPSTRSLQPTLYTSTLYPTLCTLHPTAYFVFCNFFIFL